jgi:prolipoprotein diacylglyceryltransferase
MYPVLFRLGKLTLYIYGLFIAMDFAGGILLDLREPVERLDY